MFPPAILRPFRYLTRRYSSLLCAPPEMVHEDGEPWNKDDIGAFGEKLAAHYLWAHGCGVLHRNYRAPKGGEVDVVCRDGEILLFVEVKTRTSDRYGRPMDAVDAEKERLIIRGAMHWLQLLDNPEIFFRFDVVEVLLPEGEPPTITWVKEAFGLPEKVRY